MKEGTLYKYLDIKGGKLMLKNSNLQYTNAAKFNDPFDCHPSLIDFSNVPPENCKVWGAELTQLVRSNSYRRLRERAWVSCLSKKNDILLMWSYYANHSGICIGLNMKKVSQYINSRCGFMVKSEGMEVEYREIIHKPDYFKEIKNFYHYQLCTKGEAWKHEEEVRLIIIDPFRGLPSYTPYKSKNKKKPIPENEARFCPHIGGECFESLYLGINISKRNKNTVIKLARQLNPDIKIYQMQPDPEAFRLVPKEI